MEKFTKFIFFFLAINLITYAAAAFISWDFNPAQWWLITSGWGRLVLVIIEWRIIYVLSQINF